MAQGPNPVTSRDTGCFAATFERKYYKRGNAFIKRSLRPSEYQTGYRGLHIPRLGKERLMNEAACLRFIRQRTKIPVPLVFCDFEDEKAYYIVMEYVNGISMADLQEEKKPEIMKEIEAHLVTLKNLTSTRAGGPSGLIIPPYRVTMETDNDTWILAESQTDEYVFCHNDLSQENVIVDPSTLKVNAIIDWEYAGFFPPFFEKHFYTRLGPSVATGNDKKDTTQLLDFLNSHKIDKNVTA